MATSETRQDNTENTNFSEYPKDGKQNNVPYSGPNNTDLNGQSKDVKQNDVPCKKNGQHEVKGGEHVAASNQHSKKINNSQNKSTYKDRNKKGSPKEHEEESSKNYNEPKKEKVDRKDQFLPSDGKCSSDHSSEAQRVEEEESFEFFWQKDSPFSQWHISEFTVDGITFNCAEQYMMYSKAMLFGDEETAEEILKEEDPRNHKQWGRQVQNFDQKKWDDNCVDIVKRGNKEKFSQNEKLCRIIKNTYPKTLVEASPYDKIWGIGLKKDDRRAKNKKTWRGKNLLGQALTDVRNELMKEESKSAQNSDISKDAEIQKKDNNVPVVDAQSADKNTDKNTDNSSDSNSILGEPGPHSHVCSNCTLSGDETKNEKEMSTNDNKVDNVDTRNIKKNDAFGKPNETTTSIDQEPVVSVTVKMDFAKADTCCKQTENEDCASHDPVSNDVGNTAVSQFTPDGTTDKMASNTPPLQPAKCSGPNNTDLNGQSKDVKQNDVPCKKNGQHEVKGGEHVAASNQHSKKINNSQQKSISQDINTKETQKEHDKGKKNKSVQNKGKGINNSQNKSTYKDRNKKGSPKEHEEESSKNYNEPKKEKVDRKDQFLPSDGKCSSDHSSEAQRVEEEESFEFFWQKDSPFSQWHISEFTVDGITFNCAEQYMMYSKAMLFGDEETAEEILKEEDPRNHKQWGRQVRNFDQKKWDDNCVDIVKRGNKEKFSQNEKLCRIIKNTYPKTLVEASPYDKVWGIGLKKDDRRAKNKKTWRGKNLLGQALTDVRNELMKEESKSAQNSGISKDAEIQKKDNNVPVVDAQSADKNTDKNTDNSSDSNSILGEPGPHSHVCSNCTLSGDETKHEKEMSTNDNKVDNVDTRNIKKNDAFGKPNETTTSIDQEPVVSVTVKMDFAKADTCCKQTENEDCASHDPVSNDVGNTAVSQFTPDGTTDKMASNTPPLQPAKCSGPNNTDLNGQSKDVKQNDVPCKKNGQHEVKGGEHVAASNQHSKKINNSQQKSISQDINTKETQKEHDKGKKNKSVQNKGKGINNSQNKSTYKDRNKKGSPKEHEEESSKNYNEPKKEKVDRKDQFLPSDGKCSSDHSSEAQRVEEEESFEFFWQKDSPFSQWHISEFTVDGITFNCAEQYMMYSKAMLFGDEETAEEILKEEDPRNHKQWGRQVRNFDQKKWDDNCVDIVKRGNKEKFSQNEKLCRIIKNTYPKTLVEASPYDKIWGIGLKKDDRRAKNKKTWRGKNLLGQALTDVRNELMKEESKSAQNSDISKDAEIQKKDNNVPVADAQSAEKNTDKNTDNSSDSNSILGEPGPHSHVCSNCTLSGDETKNEKEMSTNDNKVDNVDTRNIKKIDAFGKPNETTTSIDQEPVVSVTVKMDFAKADTCCKQTENEDCASHDPVSNDVGNTAVSQFTPDGTTDKMASNTTPLQPAKCSGPNNTDLNGQSKDVKQNDVPCKKNGQHEVKGGEHVAASNQHSKKINNSQQKSISQDINTKETQKEHDKGKKNKSVQNKGKGINNSQNKSTYKDRNKKGSPKEHEEESSKNYNEPKKEKVDRKDQFLPSDGKCSSDHSSEAQRVEEEESFEFFWQKDSPFSQWHISEFTVDGITFNCAEQYMMYSKAMLFGDEETAEEILKEEDPRNHKQWGRQVRNFDQKKWDDNCVDIVKRGNKEKFSQNEKLCRIIKNTYPKTLVEASPYDKIWGIGLKKDDRRAKNKKTWRGKNLLGQALTDVRNELMKEESKSAQNSDISKDAEIQKKDNNVPVADAQSAEKNTDKNTDNSSDSNSILGEPGPHSHVCSNCTLSGDETKNEKEMSTNDNKVDNVDTRNIKKIDAFGKPNETTTSIDQEPVVSVTVKMDFAKADTCCKQTENEDCASHDPVSNDVGNTAVSQFTPDGTTDKMASNTTPLQPAKCSGPNNTDLNGQSKDVKQNDVPCKKNGQHEVKGGEHVAASNQHSKKINNSQQKSISQDINTKETQKEHDKGKKNKSVQNKGKGINNSQNKSTYKDRNKKGSPKEHEEESSKNYNEPKKEKVDRKDQFLPSDGKCSSDHSSEAQRVEEEESFEFFWQKDSPFSQWHISEFTVDGITFNCAEQYMMYSKAMLFGDEETAEEILKEEDPRNHKQWGRQVRNFDQKKWDDNCVDIVKRGNKEKFSQNEKLCRIIKTTYPKTLVEASPYDKIWGIGLKKDDRRAKNKKTCRGKNLLGQALTDVRNELLKEESKSAQNSDISKDAEIQKKDNNVPVVDAQSADKNTDKNTDNSSDSNSILGEPGPHSHVCSNCTLSGDETKNEKEMSTNDNKVDNVDTRNIKKNDPFGKPNETTTSIDQEPVVSVTVKMDFAKVDTCCKQTENEDCASHDPVINHVGNTAVGQFTPDVTTDKMASNTPPLQPAKCAANQERMCSENALNNKPPEKQVDKSNTNQVISENSSGTSESRAVHTLTNDENKSSEHEGETTLYENTVEQTGQPDI